MMRLRSGAITFPTSSSSPSSSTFSSPAARQHSTPATSDTLSPVRVKPRKSVQREPGITCTRCSITFPTRESYEKHVASSDRHWVCIYASCNGDYPRKKMLMRHMFDKGHGLSCRGCGSGYVTLKERDIHLKTVKGCTVCHVHQASKNHKDQCGNGARKDTEQITIESSQPTTKHKDRINEVEFYNPPKVDMKEKRSNSVITVHANAYQNNYGKTESSPGPKTQKEDKGVGGDPQLTKPPIVIASVNASATPKYENSQNALQTNSTTASMGYTPEPDPPSDLQVSPRPPTMYKCLACTEMHQSLSASLKHLASPNCRSGLSPAKIAKLQKSWYPWEHATFFEVDARTEDYDMSYFCPACGDSFHSIAKAVAHMEQNVRSRKPQGSSRASNSSNNELQPFLWNADENEHAEALEALERGTNKLRQQFQWSRKADGIMDVLTRTYTQYPCFSTVLDGPKLEKLSKLEQHAKQAYGGLWASKHATGLARG